MSAPSTSSLSVITVVSYRSKISRLLYLHLNLQIQSMTPVSGLSGHFSEMRVLLILFWSLTFFFARVAAIYLVLSHFASFYAMLLNPASLRLSNSTDYLLFFSLDLQDIMRCLLAKHPSYRPTLEEVAQHPWLQHQKHKPRSCPDRRACQSAPVPVDPIVDRRERRQRRGNSVL